MFTGLVEGMGVVADVRSNGPGVDLRINPPAEMVEGDPVAIGESIAINGCCLTVVAATAEGWTFQAGTETLKRTNLGELSAGNRVNLERSLLANGRIGGHFVQGHVDGTGVVDAIDREGEWVMMSFRVPTPLARLIVEKGSVAVDGVSLTIVHVNDERFGIALIPHTLEVTTLGVRSVGDRVNIETDILGKYVERLINGREADAAAP